VCNVHTLAFASLVTATKLHQDVRLEKNFLVDVSGLKSTAQVNKVQVTFIEACRYRLFVTVREYYSFARWLVLCTDPILHQMQSAEHAVRYFHPELFASLPQTVPTGEVGAGGSACAENLQESIQQECCDDDDDEIVSDTPPARRRFESEIVEESSAGSSSSAPSYMDDDGSDAGVVVASESPELANRGTRHRIRFVSETSDDDSEWGEEVPGRASLLKPRLASKLRATARFSLPNFRQQSF